MVTYVAGSIVIGMILVFNNNRGSSPGFSVRVALAVSQLRRVTPAAVLVPEASVPVLCSPTDRTAVTVHSVNAPHRAAVG